MYFILLLSMVFFIGVVGVVSNPSPCFGALSLVLASGFGCGVIAEIGDVFSALILFLIYLGGMLVVFAYSVSLSSDLHPEMVGVRGMSLLVLGLVWLVFIFSLFGVLWLPLGLDGVSVSSVFDSGYFGVSLLYSVGGLCLLSVGFGLLLTLFVVLELVREISFGALGLYN